MLDDLLKQIDGLLRDGKDSKDGEKTSKNITVGNVGDNSTVVIVNGNNGPRRRQSDKPHQGPDDPGRRAADQELQKELERLRYQVKALDRLVEHLLLKKTEPVLKRKLGGGALSLTSSGTKRPFSRMSQFTPSRGRRARAGVDSPQSPAVSGFYHLPPPNSIYYRLSQTLCPLTPCASAANPLFAQESGCAFADLVLESMHSVREHSGNRA